MATLTVTGKGQLTLRKGVLEHIGVRPGEAISLELMPDGTAALRAAERTHTIDDMAGLLAGKSKKIASLEEIRKAASEGWARKG
ncbi:MAG: AbrB/MazE/SpoVT family DNA-binding domain-containing protein [Acidobacteria bacterium]|nr:AbrB/MazE/SpoVT family DNA-binding domain-containing protein [Acidobacteriota bacterium]